MIRVLKKWKITVTFRDQDSISFNISDDFYTNVLRKIADMDWDKMIMSITIAIVDSESQTGVAHNANDSNIPF